MLIFQAIGLGYRYDAQLDPLFSGLELLLYTGEKVALLGANGAGKSTLLGLIAGTLPVQEGQLIRHTDPLYLEQDDTLSGDAPVLEAVLATYPDLGPLRAEMQMLEADGVPDPLRYADLLSLFAERGGYEVETELQSALMTLGYDSDVLTRPLTSFSGGEQRLLRLASAFVRPGRLMLLDEPTNYLDERATEQLASWIRASEATCLIVSHDRKFLDETVTDVLELERSSLTRYSGTYSSFWDQKENDYQERVRRSGRLKREITALKEQERTYKVWGARKEKEKSGAADRGFIGARAARLMKRGIQAKERLQDRIVDLEDARPWIEKRYSVAFEEVQLPTGVCLSAREVSVMQERVSITVEYGERLALVGANGSGKTTLLRKLLDPNGSTIVWDSRAKIGYLPQLWDETLDARTPESLFVKEQHQRARLLLGAFNVSGSHFAEPLSELSEGQKRKVALVRLILQEPNVLVLDEPTTHLDYMSVEMLEAALQRYSGTLILVSHDRYLLERTTTRHLELQKEG